MSLVCWGALARFKCTWKASDMLLCVCMCVCILAFSWRAFFCSLIYLSVQNNLTAFNISKNALFANVHPFTAAAASYMNTACPCRKRELPTLERTWLFSSMNVDNIQFYSIYLSIRSAWLCAWIHGFFSRSFPSEPPSDSAFVDPWQMNVSRTLTLCLGAHTSYAHAHIDNRGYIRSHSHPFTHAHPLTVILMHLHLHLHT